MSPKANPVPKAIGREGCKINLICVMMIIAWRGNFVATLPAKPGEYTILFKVFTLKVWHYNSTIEFVFEFLSDSQMHTA